MASIFISKHRRLYALQLLGKPNKDKTATELAGLIKSERAWVAKEICQPLLDLKILTVSKKKKRFNEKKFSLNYLNLGRMFIKFCSNPDNLLSYVDGLTLNELSESQIDIKKIQEKAQSISQYTISEDGKPLSYLKEVLSCDVDKVNELGWSIYDFFYAIYLTFTMLAREVPNPQSLFLDKLRRRIENEENRDMKGLMKEELDKHQLFQTENINPAIDPLFQNLAELHDSIYYAAMKYREKNYRTKIIEEAILEKSDYGLTREFSFSWDETWFYTDEYIEKYNQLMKKQSSKIHYQPKLASILYSPIKKKRIPEKFKKLPKKIKQQLNLNL